MELKHYNLCPRWLGICKLKYAFNNLQKTNRSANYLTFYEINDKAIWKVCMILKTFIDFMTSSICEWYENVKRGKCVLKILSILNKFNWNWAQMKINLPCDPLMWSTDVIHWCDPLWINIDILDFQSQPNRILRVQYNCKYSFVVSAVRLKVLF